MKMFLALVFTILFAATVFADKVEKVEVDKELYKDLITRYGIIPSWSGLYSGYYPYNSYYPYGRGWVYPGYDYLLKK